MFAAIRSKVALVAALGSLSFLAADWPQFRGPDGQGVSAETDLPVGWNGETNVFMSNILWRYDMPGPGTSSPIVHEGVVYLTAYSGYGVDQNNPGDQKNLRRHIAAIDLVTGQKRWDLTAQATLPEKEFGGFLSLHGYASSTPVTDGEALYVFFGKSGVGALSLAGKPLWRQIVGTGTHGWGSASSPVVYNDLVIVNASVESDALMALNKMNGREVWRADDINSAWNSPVLVEVDGHQEVVISCKTEILALDPATGEPLWRCDGIEDYVCPSVVAHDGVIYAIGGRTKQCIAVTAGGTGVVTQTHRLWTAGEGSNVSSPVYYDGYLYFVHESQGVAYCLDAKTGGTVYEERMSPRPGRIYASPIVADGKIYVVSRENGTFVLAAKPEYELIAHSPHLDDSVHNATPAIVDGRVLLRSNKAVYCIAKGDE